MLDDKEIRLRCIEAAAHALAGKVSPDAPGYLPDDTAGNVIRKAATKFYDFVNGGKVAGTA